MKLDDFRSLLTRAEGETLDFKGGAGYDLKNAHGRNAFVKDLLALANTPRDSPAYLVLGVQWTAEAGSTVEGLGCQFDDVKFQDLLGSGLVQPIPRFTYTPIEFEGLQVGVVEIPPTEDGPYTPVRDLGELQAGAIYYRRGSQNNRAVGPEHKRIVKWFLRGEIGLPEDTASDSWRRLFEAVHRFEPTATYLLAVDALSRMENAPINALAMPPWRAVIDFDPNSDVSGLLSSMAGSLGRHRVIHRVVREEYRVQPEPGTHWFFARGLSGSQTLSDGSHTTWLKSYKQELGKQLKSLASVISPSPIIALILWSDITLRSHLRTLIEELHGAFGETVEVVVVSNDGPSFEALAKESGATFIRMTLRSLCGGIAVHYSDLQSGTEQSHVLPTQSGAPIEIATEDWLWFSEDLELVDRGTGLVGNDDEGDYRRGADVTWRNLQLRHDCDRDITPDLRGSVEAALQKRQTVRINLYHAPGGGGTTVGRRVLWDLRQKFPTGILKRCAPRDTAGRIARVAALTENSVLLVVDGGQHSERDIDDLYDFLKAGQTPVVLLQVLRRPRSQEPGKRPFWLDAQLSNAEADRFRDGYTRAVPSKSSPLTALAQQHNSPRRNAFFFGLTAFGKDFRGLVRFVTSRITGLTAEQRRILVYIAMAHYYGQQSVPAQTFASLLGLPRSKTLNFAAVFADNSESVLDLLVEGGTGEWRTAHHLVALEIMQQVLSPAETQERESVWRQSLSSWGRDFASFCRGQDQQTGDRLLELVRRVYIYRDNTEVLGTERAGQKRFSQLVEDIPSTHGKIEVLRHLTECFPLEAHFHAHLGRFLGLIGEYAKGLECVEFAISLQPDDHVPHHMRGMILRQSLRADFEAGATIDQVVDSAKRATESFEESRRLSPDIAHGYISEVQMLVDILDLVGRGRGNSVREVLARAETNPFLRQAIDRAEDLLDRAQYLYAGESPSQYVLDCQARLQRIYGDYSTALQSWDNLLTRPEVAKPPVRRQIVWTILRRCDGAWNKLKKKEIDRVCRLLEENLEEEVKDSTSLRLWLRAIRQSQNPPTLDAVIEKVSYWKINTGSLDAAYYLYLLHVLQALNGSSQEAANAERALEECRALARYRRDRTRSFEWIGAGKGVQALVHQSQLGEWRDDFWEATAALVRLEGRIASIDGPQKGTIELDGGVVAFFVPARSGFHFGRDENAPVVCYLGFSYDGPRAWDVQRAGT